MEIRVRLFASLAEAVGRRELTLCGLAEPATAGAVGEALFERFPQAAEMRESVMYAVNAEYVQADFPVTSRDSVALIPPVSGGAAGDEGGLFRIVEEAISADALHALVLRPEAGAVAVFLGVVRDNNLGREVDYLEYDAYPEMAERVMGRIGEEIRARWDVAEVAMLHRVGRLEIGEASVGVAVSSAHRAEATDACRYGIDRLKAVVPIWKKEVWSDGEEWIEGSLTAAGELE